MILKSKQDKRETEPRSRQSKFYLKLSSTVLSDFPPYFTITSWMIIVKTTIKRKSLLLKKLSKTLYSSAFSFLALISLKTCSSTKTLKKME